MQETLATMTTSGRSSRGPRRRKPEFFDFLVDVGILLDVRIGAGEVRLGLVVVVVGDEVLDGVFRKEVAELGKKLGGQGLIRSKDKRGFLDGLDDPRHGQRLAGPGHAEKGLERIGFVAPVDQLADGFRLIAPWL